MAGRPSLVRQRPAPEKGQKVDSMSPYLQQVREWLVLLQWMRWVVSEVKQEAGLRLSALSIFPGGGDAGGGGAVGTVFVLVARGAETGFRTSACTAGGNGEGRFPKAEVAITRGAETGFGTSACTAGGDREGRVPKVAVEDLSE